MTTERGTDPWCTAVVHGTREAYQQGCRCTAARRAATKYQKVRLYDRLLGQPRTVDATGTRRRLRALVRLGWSFVQLGERLGCRGEAVRQLAFGTARRTQNQCWSSTARRVKALYNGLSMTPPPERTHSERQIASRTRNYAIRRGFDPPFAWDDDTIDDPAAEPDCGEPDEYDQDSYDHAAVERLVGEGRRPRVLTHAEAAEVCRRLRAAGVSTHEMRHIYGLKAERYGAAS